MKHLKIWLYYIENFINLIARLFVGMVSLSSFKFIATYYGNYNRDFMVFVIATIITIWIIMPMLKLMINLGDD